jgi:hypothetical protein
MAAKPADGFWPLGGASVLDLKFAVFTGHAPSELQIQKAH